MLAHGSGVDEIITIVFTVAVVAAVWVAARRDRSDRTGHDDDGPGV